MSLGQMVLAGFPPILPKDIYKVEFWHAQNYACLRASEAGLPGGSAARLAGDQLSHWNTLSPDSIFQATHLIVFLPSCLSAFVLSNHSSHSPAFFKYPLPDLQTNEGPTACVKQVANCPLPSILLNQDEKIASARKSVADSYLSSSLFPFLRSLKPSSKRRSSICENHARKMRTFFARRLEPNVSHKVCS